MPKIMQRLANEKPWQRNLFTPAIETYVGTSASFMTYSSCSAADFFHPHFHEISREIGVTVSFQRKFWEWVFIVYHLRTAIKPNGRGIVFGVGEETLPALFASRGAKITATDAPSEIGVNSGWKASHEYAGNLAALPNGNMDRESFEKAVEWRECDMNAIDPSFTDYDFCWSSCCLEHLGSLRAGLDFILNTVEKVLKVGGRAVHTTELNLSSNDLTVTEGQTVLYRRRDLESFIEEVRSRGHRIQPLRIAPDSMAVDGYVDTPPYSYPHLKLELEGHVATSVGLVIERGR